MILLVANTVPLYRMMAADFAHYKPDPRPWWAVAGMLVVQIAYWIGVRSRLPLPPMRNIVLGHLVSFAARMTFVVMTASFTMIFMNKYEALMEMDYPPLRALLVFGIFFSVFCWMLELERLAKALQGSNT